MVGVILVRVDGDPVASIELASVTGLSPEPALQLTDRDEQDLPTANVSPGFLDAASRLAVRQL